MTLRNFLFGFGLLAIVLTIFPYVPVEHWSVRMFDFPQLQLALLTLVAILTYFIKFQFNNWRDYVFVGLLLTCFIVQGYRIFPYTAFAPHELLDSTTETEPAIGLYNANVLQKNDQHDSLAADIARHDPDVVLLLETDKTWARAMDSHLSGKYPQKIKAPHDNTYGMLLYSKLPLVDGRVQYMVEDTIPSIHAKVIARSKDTFQLIAIHPTPPVVMHAANSIDRDAEMMLAAEQARKSPHPVIVLGDFNDVSWSETTELFKKVSELLDPRIGRGMYNTFNAKNPIMRWPLDHIFVSEEFRLVSVTRGKDIGSDHYPYFVKLRYEPSQAREQAPKPPTEQELKEAFEQLREERRNNTQ